MEFDFNSPTRGLLCSIDIHELLPQQKPFVMVGRLIHFDERTTETETEIKADNIFVDDGLFSASGLIENIAQTCAVRIGYVNRFILKRVTFPLCLISRRKAIFLWKNYEKLHSLG